MSAQNRPTELEEIAHRFSYHPPRTDKVRALHEAIRARLGNVALDLHALLPAGREKALVLTKLEEAMFWANAAIARDNAGGEGS